MQQQRGRMNFENLDELKSRAEALKTKTAEMRGYL
jgi:hypothetical protein